MAPDTRPLSHPLSAAPPTTAAAIEWDEEFKRAALEVGGDQSGRSVDVHDSAYKDVVAVASGRERAEAEAAKKNAAKL